jgi:MFS family permease
VLVPLIIADMTRGTGHFNLAQGAVGSAVGIGASLSPMIAGHTTDQYGSAVAFFGLAALATVGFVSVLLLMPETGNGPSGPVNGRVAQARDILPQGTRSTRSNLRNAPH